ncbi:hypothetical protein G6F50_018522 [Rhizopus delemar]|uniref:Uncharacterized protein n=1 Tax=Rhizopus delemar TaxID=936053 RepID=A0A9P7BYM6_9FUNG|nr:hypothetical protein G6F50_018522 [Rhizopus delemar]
MQADQPASVRRPASASLRPAGRVRTATRGGVDISPAGRRLAGVPGGWRQRQHPAAPARRLRPAPRR